MIIKHHYSLRRKSLNIILALLLLIPLNLKNVNLQAQPIRIVKQEMRFGNVLEMPIEILVEQSEEQVVFSAKNKSYFPYELELRFTKIINLNPPTRVHKNILQPGINTLFILKIGNQEEQVDYSYTIRYSMGSSHEKADKSYPYLVPIGIGKKVEYRSGLSGSSSIVYPNNFKMNAGDTVYASRKGFVTALPGDPSRVERIVKETSFEVRHADGTVAVYKGIDPEQLFSDLGERVYPGQAIGIVDNKEVLSIKVFELTGGGNISNFIFLYIIEEDILSTAFDISNRIVRHPRKVIVKEMTKREIKKLDKGKL